MDELSSYYPLHYGHCSSVHFIVPAFLSVKSLNPNCNHLLLRSKLLLPMRLSLYLLLFVSLIFLPFACGKTEHLQGESLYLQNCSGCHFESGQGLRQLMPPLAGSDYLEKYPELVVRGIRRGMLGEMVVNGKVYNHEMPGNKELSDFQIVNIMNYINQAWGNDYGNITVPDCRKWLQE
ncbi:MAG: cytochrome c553 [Bdellovibrionota bacterium]|jgi:cytochrome c553